MVENYTKVVYQRNITIQLYANALQRVPKTMPYDVSRKSESKPIEIPAKMAEICRFSRLNDYTDAQKHGAFFATAEFLIILCHVSGLHFFTCFFILTFLPPCGVNNNNALGSAECRMSPKWSIDFQPRESQTTSLFNVAVGRLQRM